MRLVAPRPILPAPRRRRRIAAGEETTVPRVRAPSPESPDVRGSSAATGSPFPAPVRGPTLDIPRPARAALARGAPPSSTTHFPEDAPVRSDLDGLMQQRGLAGLVVLALDRYSPAFYYATGQKIHHGFYVRTSAGLAHLVHDPMERDQAALVGCETSSYAQRGFLQKVKSAESQARALGELVAEVTGELGITGRVAFAGEVPLGFGWLMLDHLKQLAPALQVDSTQPDVLS